MDGKDSNAMEQPGGPAEAQNRMRGDSHRRRVNPERTSALADRCRARNWDDAARQTLDAWNAFASGQSTRDKIKMPDRLPALCSCYLWLKSVGIVKPDSPSLIAMELRLTSRIAGKENCPPRTAAIRAGAMMLRMVFTHAQRTGTDLGTVIERVRHATTDAEKASMKWTGLANYRL